MVVVKFRGGMGNQMFQYATARAIAIKFNKELYFDLRFLQTNQNETDEFTPRQYSLDIFTVKGQTIRSGVKVIANKLIKSIFKVSVFPEYHKYDDHSDLNNVQFPACLDGYFQSENYFSEYRKSILTDFTFKLPLDEANEMILQRIRETQSVAVHVRRGDYVNKPKVTSIHGICDEGYYDTALKLLGDKIPKAVYYFFTDDPEWVQHNIIDKFRDFQIILVKNNYGEDSWKDMFLMCNCKYHIIANSSFSWWGAWLSQYPKQIVVAPSKWFTNADFGGFPQEIVPESWIKI
jgi:hypothetical protein